ncbi:unnamed protein product, partial [Mesorhabditis spiculigera]
MESKVESGALTAHPWKRARTTTQYLTVAILGNEEERKAYREAVNSVHRHVKSDANSPVRYNAFNRELQLWVAACLFIGFEDSHQLLHGKMSEEQAESFYQSASTLGTTLQVTEEMWPATRADFERYWNLGCERVVIDERTKQYLIDLVNLQMIAWPIRLAFRKLVAVPDGRIPSTDLPATNSTSSGPKTTAAGSNTSSFSCRSSTGSSHAPFVRPATPYRCATFVVGLRRARISSEPAARNSFSILLPLQPELLAAGALGLSAGTASAATHDWSGVAECESSGNWAANTGNGYYGGLQFSTEHVEAYGGAGSAANASQAEQVRVAENVLAVRHCPVFVENSTDPGQRRTSDLHAPPDPAPPPLLLKDITAVRDPSG